MEPVLFGIVRIIFGREETRNVSLSLSLVKEKMLIATDRLTDPLGNSAWHETAYLCIYTYRNIEERLRGVSERPAVRQPGSQPVSQPVSRAGKGRGR